MSEIKENWIEEVINSVMYCNYSCGCPYKDEYKKCNNSECECSKCIHNLLDNIINCGSSR